MTYILWGVWYRIGYIQGRIQQQTRVRQCACSGEIRYVHLTHISSNLLLPSLYRSNWIIPFLPIQFKSCVLLTQIHHIYKSTRRSKWGIASHAISYSCAHLHFAYHFVFLTCNSFPCLNFVVWMKRYNFYTFIHRMLIFVGQYNALQMHLEEMQCYSPYSWWNREAHKRNSSWVSWL